MTQRIIPKRRHTGAGYGLVLILVFFLATLLLAVSLQMTGASGAMTAAKETGDNISAYNVAMTAFPAVRSDIATKLGAGTTVDTSYTLSGNFSVPSNPVTMTGSTTVGSYVATIPYANANFFLVAVKGTVNKSVYTVTKLMEIQKSPPAAFNCSAIESTIAAGNISTISDANLILYAQNGCMLKPDPDATPPTAPTFNTPNPGTGTSYNCNNVTQNITTASPANRGYISNYCNLNAAAGTAYALRFSQMDTNSSVYIGNTTTLSMDTDFIDNVTVNIGNSTMAQVNLNSLRNYSNLSFAGGAASAVSIGGTGVLSNSTLNSNATTAASFNVSTIDNSTINGPNNGATGSYWLNGVQNYAHLNGGSGTDTFSITGNVVSNSSIAGFTGNDIYKIGGYLDLSSITTGAGNNALHLTTVRNYTNINTGDGNNQLYFRGMTSGSNANISVGNGNNLIACNSTMGAGTCSGIDLGHITVGGGNNIISVDGDLTNYSNINTGNGYNLVYVKAMNTNSQINTGSNGKSLVIVAGNRDSCNVNSSGPNNVLLIKTGTTNGSYVTLGGFARTLYY